MVLWRSRTAGTRYRSAVEHPSWRLPPVGIPGSPRAGSPHDQNGISDITVAPALSICAHQERNWKADEVSPATTDVTAPYATPRERADRGREARVTVPRASHGDWSAAPDRRDPLSILEQQELTRVPELVPIRHARMAASPFAFYRGAAAVMAADLALGPRTPLHVQLCGDAHLANFGGFASPERDLVFDVNDFDETLPGPFEWDLKRLGASFEIAGRARGLGESDRNGLVSSSARAYREAILEFSNKRTLEIWNAHLDAAEIVRRWGSEVGKSVLAGFRRAASKAETKDHLKAFEKLTIRVDGALRFTNDPPLLVPVQDLLGAESETEATIKAALRSYRRTLSGDRQHLFDRYRYLDLARKVVGVGSVGTRCWVALFVGRDEGDPLFLQVKEAEASVLEPYVGKSRYANHGQRVVEGQRLMQGASDIMLGWDQIVAPDGVTRDFYMRQLWDWKISADLELMRPDALRAYAQICGWTLARAHARSGDEIAIGAYLGGGKAFDHAIADFSSSYAEQNQVDYQALVNAVADGDLIADAGV